MAVYDEQTIITNSLALVQHIQHILTECHCIRYILSQPNPLIVLSEVQQL